MSAYAASGLGLWLGCCEDRGTSKEREHVRGERADWFAAMSGRRGSGRGPGSHGFAWWAPLAGQPPFGPPPWAAGRGPRPPKARRGDVRAAILSVLSDASLNGYQIIQEIADRSGGVWKPSPGSIYPTLQQLEDEGLVRAEVSEGRRAYCLTDEGRTYVAEHADEVGAPWQGMNEPAGGEDDALKPLIGQVAAAIWQIVAVGTPDQQAKAKDALIDLRRTLHTILASDESTDDRP